MDVDAVPTLKLPWQPETKLLTLTETELLPQTNTNFFTLAGVESSPTEKRKIYEDDSAQSQKKIKTETNASNISSGGGDVPSLELTSLSPMPSSTANEVPGQYLASVSKPAPLHLNEYNNMLGDNNSKPKVYPNFAQLSAKGMNENSTALSRQVNKLMNSDTLQETQSQAQKKTNEVTKNLPFLGINEKLQGMIKGASTLTLQIHAIQMRMQQIINSRKAYCQLSLKLYLRNPKAYTILQKPLGVSPKSELKDVFKDTIISTERGTMFPIYLSQKTNIMTVTQKQCFICIGESKIKPRIYYDIKKDRFLGIHDFDEVLKPEPATTAVVLIVQGIYDEWKLPVAVGYLGNNSPSIKPWVDKNVKSLIEIGFNVRAIVYNMDSKLFNSQYHIHYITSRKKMYCTSDVSALFKSLYYNFTKCDYYFNGLVAKSQHIVDYYELDRKKKIRLTPKLTINDVKPTNFQELNIKSVMEVFSMPTAAAISAYTDFNILDKSANDTVLFITKMSKLFDIIIPDRLDDESKSKKEKVFASEECEIFFLNEILGLFDSLKLVKPTNQSSMDETHKILMEKFKMLIRTILSLTKNLKSENFDDLPSCSFTSTKAADLFFDQVQKHSKSITKPTAKDVDLVFKQTAVIHLLKNPVKDFTPIQMHNVLTEFQIIIKGFKLIDDSYAHRDLDPINYIISSSEYTTLDMERKDGIIFLAGFLLQKCTGVHLCDNLRNYNSRTANDVETLSMCESIMDDVQKNICVIPSAEFIEFVESMEILFRTFMNKEILCSKKILGGLLKSLEIVHAPMPCICFPVNYVKKLYTRFRIYHTLKYNNELIRTKRNRRLIVNKL